MNDKTELTKEDFAFDLPSELIAQQPLQERRGSRLLVCSRANESLHHHHFPDILQYLKPGDCLVINNTRVLPARLYAHKPTGGRVEVFLERVLDEKRFIAQIKASKAPPAGTTLLVDDSDDVITVCGRADSFFECEASSSAGIFIQHGHMPLPHYITREATREDESRYQTVFAKHDGAVAAPTAGLHFDEALLAQCRELGVTITEVTLHVGAGTFQPLRVSRITDHTMHAEWLEVTKEACDVINNTKARGGRVVAVGTTSVRSLETAAADGSLKPFQGDSRLFIYPGYQFRVVDALITNFHLPESTLFMLVCALAGKAFMESAYQAAIDERYRFFSYGDAMFIV